MDPHDRSIELLSENLSAVQREQYGMHRYFDVIGGESGRRYRIRHGQQMNVEEFDVGGQRVCRWCFFPGGGLAVGDVMLAQKTALELFERDALSIANRFSETAPDMAQRYMDHYHMFHHP